ncbi:MAG: DNA starvation/stationary phase protection protein [Alphaproteobacteria bacterium]|nr:DNA starvation/stationary phase protection protein [Alphaproteobacteria bacterium]
MEELIQAMKVVLANHYALSLKGQYYHWNVEGSDFAQYHEFFGNFYDEVSGAIDKCAEEVRSAGAYAPGSFERFMQLSEISGENSIIPARAMFERLLSDIDIIQASIMNAYNLAELAKQHGYSNFMAERQDAFNKHAWMLRSLLKNM